MKEQGHLQSTSVLAHESSSKGGAAFRLPSEYQPTGDQPQAIAKLVEGFKEGNQAQTLLGVTGSGKTFTMAANDRIHSTLTGMVNGSARTYLQDAVITQRNGRYCIPVKAEYRSQVPGMIHDQSSTGSTLFVEPMAVVKLKQMIYNEGWPAWSAFFYLNSQLLNCVFDNSRIVIFTIQEL